MPSEVLKEVRRKIISLDQHSRARTYSVDKLTSMKLAVFELREEVFRLYHKHSNLIAERNAGEYFTFRKECEQLIHRLDVFWMEVGDKKDPISNETCHVR
jgi:hypothetical protein